jgi:formylglycine-generating enzyme required for sulfatase activity
MHGNVWQWTDTTAAGLDRVYRGGSWYNFAWNCRAAGRGKLGSSKENCYTGFRLARVPVR